MTPRRVRVRLASIGLGLALALVALAPESAAAPKASRAPRVPIIYHRSRSFRIPFNVDPAERPRFQEVQLWVSEDSGFTWKRVNATTPDRPSFTFRAGRDAEYWFAVRTLDKQGRLFPGESEQVEPSMKVVVDTMPPSLLLEPEDRRGSMTAVRWEVRDEHLDLNSLKVFYQAEGARDWREVPLHRPALLGSETWDAGTADTIKVHAEIKDKAGNLAEADVTLPEGTPSGPNSVRNETGEFSAPPPIAQENDEPPRRTGRPGRFGTVSNAQAVDGFGSEPDPFGGPGGGGADAAAPASSRAEGGASGSLLVRSPRFPLAYAVDDAGPEGPATVELWVTQDGGRTWIRRGEDQDRVSPFEVDLGGEGTFGLALVARGASGLGDQPPAPGDPPQVWVEVDNTPPKVQMFPPLMGSGANLGKIAITWSATDLHLAPQPVTLSWRPDTQGSRWQPIVDAMENTGKFVWTVPPDLPHRFHIRVDVVDTVGNRGSADTVESGPIRLDRTRPRSRIIGLDPSARGGMGGGARPLR